MSFKDDPGQVYTLEGLVAAVLVIGLLVFIAQSVSVVSPQTEMTSSMKLQQKTSDTLICLDRLNETNMSELKSTISCWGGIPADYASNYPVPSGEKNSSVLDQKIRGYLRPDENYSDVNYNVEIFYHNTTGDHTMPLILHGKPGDNSVIASRLITINDGDCNASLWEKSDYFPQVVEVRLISWYI